MKHVSFTTAFTLGEQRELGGMIMSFFGSTGLAYSISYEERTALEQKHNIKILCPQAWDLHHRADRLLRAEVERCIHGLTMFVVWLSWEGMHLFSYIASPNTPFSEAVKAKKRGALILKDLSQLNDFLKINYENNSNCSISRQQWHMTKWPAAIQLQRGYAPFCPNDQRTRRIDGA